MKTKILSVVFLAVSLISAVALFAAEHYDAVYPIHATPFDGKLASVGFFDPYRNTPEIPDKVQSVDALFQIAKSFRYVPHGPQDQWQTAEETASKGSGNCADKAVWLYSQLRQNGYTSARLVIGRYRSIDPTFHVWITYMDASGNDFILDPTLQRRPWKISDFSQNLYKPLYSFSAGTRYRVVS